MDWKKRNRELEPDDKQESRQMGGRHSGRKQTNREDPAHTTRWKMGDVQVLQLFHGLHYLKVEYLLLQVRYSNGKETKKCSSKNVTVLKNFCLTWILKKDYLFD